MTDPLGRMRRGNPVTNVESPPIEPVLARIARTPWRATSPRRRLYRLATLALVLVLLVAAAALAASGLLVGDPIRPHPGVTFSPSHGLGVPIKGSDQLFALRVADPAGGPDWGLRLVSTTRDLGCLQVGRVVDGRLGVLGRNGAFTNDGRFHELPARVLDQANCTLLDRRRQAFLAVSVQGIPASAMPAGCTVQPIPEMLRNALPKARARDQPPLCARDSLRILYYGLLGPHAESVTYPDSDGVRRTVRVQGAQGAYLIVNRPRPGRRPPGHYSTMAGPGSGLTSVRYRDGHVCTIPSPRRTGGARPCPPVGYRAPRRPRVTSAQVAAPIRVRVRRLTSGPAKGQYRVDLSFTARVAVRSGRSSYAYTARYPRSQGCDSVATSGPSIDDVAAGQTVRLTFYAPSSCPGLLTGTVNFAYHDPLSAMPFGEGPRPDIRTLVGRFQVRIPR